MRILLADNQSKIRFALRALLEQRPGLKIVGEASDADELLVQSEATCPDLVLLDWRLQGLAVLELLPALRKVCPNVYVIALSGRPEVRLAALEAGADAFVSKVDPPGRLLATIDDYEREQHRPIPSQQPTTRLSPGCEQREKESKL